MLISSHAPTFLSTNTLASLRALIPQRRLNRAEVRQLTERQATRLRSHLGETDDPFFDEAKLRDLPRIRVEWDADLPTSGMSLWDGDNWVLAVNSRESLTRQRFSLLHEFHHAVAHGVKDRLFHETSAERRGHCEQAERTADYFAACVLMPKMLVKRHWGRGPRTIRSMADLFGVSPQAMTYRLRDLGLLGERRRCNWTKERTTRAR